MCGLPRVWNEIVVATDLEMQRSAGDTCVGEDERVVEDKVGEGETGESSLMGSIPAGRGEELGEDDKMGEGETEDSSYLSIPAGRGEG